MQGPSNISFIGGEISCGFCAYHSHIENGGADSAPPRNILFDGVYFHDWHSVSGEHTECLQILGGDTVTIRNSTFKNCGTGNNGLGATGDLFVGFLGGTGPVTKNILLENNFFYPSGNAYAIQMSDLENLDLRYNSIAGPIIIFDREGPGTGMDFIGNILRARQLHRRKQRRPDQLALQRHARRHLQHHRQKRRHRLHRPQQQPPPPPHGSAAINAGDPHQLPQPRHRRAKPAYRHRA